MIRIADIKDDTIVLVTDSEYNGNIRPSLYGFIFTDADRARMMHDITTGRYYKNPREMTYSEFATAEKAHWDGLCATSKEITEEQYEYALNVLPPRNYSHSPGFTRFTMSEMQSGSYTEMYACMAGAHEGDPPIFLCKLVNVLDRSTWIHG